jgi:hypothetical protein
MPPLAEVIERYGIDALCKALAPEIVREATATAWTPPEDRADGYECLAAVKVVWREWSGEWVYTGEFTAFVPLPGDAP